MDIAALLRLCEKIKIRMMYDDIMYETAEPWLDMLTIYINQALDSQNREVYELLWELKTEICYECAACELNAAIDRAQSNGEW